MPTSMIPRESRVLPTPLRRLRDEMEDLFSQFWGEEENGGWMTSQLSPLLDLSETDDSMQVRMDLPGVKPDEIDIQISGNLLTVRGEKREEKEEKGRTFQRIERRSGSFARRITLPCEVQDDQIDARSDDGVLSITLPKCETSKARRIAVKG